MSTIPLSPELIEMIQNSLTDPKGNGQEFDPFHECFEKSEKVTAKHILAQEYLERINRPNIPKVILYIVMDKELGLCNGKDESGSLGYHLTIKKKIVLNKHRGLVTPFSFTYSFPIIC